MRAVLILVPGAGVAGAHAVRVRFVVARIIEHKFDVVDTTEVPADGLVEGSCALEHGCHSDYFVYVEVVERLVEGLRAVKRAIQSSNA